MESFVAVGTALGCSAGIAVGGLVFAAYKLGLLYQLFHKVGCVSVPFSTCIFLSKHCTDQVVAQAPALSVHAFKKPTCIVQAVPGER